MRVGYGLFYPDQEKKMNPLCSIPQLWVLGLLVMLTEVDQSSMVRSGS